MALSFKRILIVDDIDQTRRRLKSMLRKMGMTNVDEASNGDAAWDMIEKAQKDQRPYEIIMSNWEMTPINGLELFKKTRKKEIPFLMMMTETKKELVMAGIEAGVGHYIVKPFSEKTLRDKIGHLVMK